MKHVAHCEPSYALYHLSRHCEPLYALYEPYGEFYFARGFCQGWGQVGLPSMIKQILNSFEYYIDIIQPKYELSCVLKSHKFVEAFANFLPSSGIKFCTWKIRRKSMLAYKMYDHGRKTHLTPARLVFHNGWSIDNILKHISGHNSGPRARRKVKPGRKESSECDLANGKPPRRLGRHFDEIIRVQRVNMKKKIQKCLKTID